MNDLQKFKCHSSLTPFPSLIPQFRLRSLLLLVSGLAVLFAGFGWRWRRATNQASTVALIRSNGGAVRFASDDRESSWLNLRLIEVLGEARAGTVVAVRLGQESDGDAALKRISRLPYIEELLIDSDSVSDDGVAHLARLSRLKVLRLNSPFVSSRGIRVLAELSNMEEVTLSSQRIDDEACQHLEKLETLKFLGLNTSMSPESVTRLRVKLPGCRIETAN